MAMLNVSIQVMIMKQRSSLLFQQPQEGYTPCESYSNIYKLINLTVAWILATKAYPRDLDVFNIYVVGEQAGTLSVAGSA